MATLSQIGELLERIPDGGVINSNDRWDKGYFSRLIGIYRAKLAQLVYSQNKRLHPQWYQKHYPAYDLLLQDEPGCSVKFSHPEVIMLDDRSDGFRYIGSVDCNNNFARIASRGWLSTFNDNRTTKINTKRRTSVLYDGYAQVLEIYGDPEVEAILTESIVADPLMIPTFNQQQDQYPIPENLVSEVVNMIFNDNVAVEARIPIGYGITNNFPQQKRKANK